MSIRIVVAEDHALLREMLCNLLRREPGLEVVGEAADGRTLIRQVQETRPDVVVADISLPELNGIDATSRLMERYPSLRILCLSAHTEPSYVRAMLRAGAAGYVSKSIASEELVRAVLAVASGQSYLCPEAACVALGELRSGPARSVQSAGLLSLGRREREVLQLIAEGHRTVDIASRMAVSPNTVETHRRNLMRKLDVHTTVDLVRLAIREGLARP